MTTITRIYDTNNGRLGIFTIVRASPSLSPRIRLILIDWPNSVVSNFRSLCKAHIRWPAATRYTEKCTQA